ncbi:methyl-CpG-binding domain-containing protein 2 [Andrographis paniculata]|uniref:methyl-CpG-binding domain-containing protein 2 n=1 Tax=Andrographis paniculata TaxID=175694 RepID=UPI0021E93EC0|nr:methyl-CpG-binding domain-containing protein 2 [Andrographis paniculata]XP_051149010.1 methyl-CpG-binding domain-containing protein 2 [Andrographis paniculata]
MEETAMKSLKVTIKLNGKNVDTNSPNRVNENSAGGSEKRSPEAVENQTEDSGYQLVLYDPSVNGANGTVQDPVNYQSPSSRLFPFPNRVLPSVGAFTVQCANCFKWRLIPTKEKYEEIREHILEHPFYCETGREWRPDISCNDPPDITQDGSRLWAIDKPSIAQPPPGWQRLLRIRSEGSSKFADVYYASPSGKRLRSMVEVQRYLDENPGYKEEGISLSKFSFQIPRPLREDYVRKRQTPIPTRATSEQPEQDGNHHGTPESFDPAQVKPISWMSPQVDTDLQLSVPGPSTRPSKKKTPTKRRRNGASDNNQNGINGQDPHIV